MSSCLKFRKQYCQPGRDQEEAAAARINTGPDTPVQQQFKADADINELVRRFGLLGKAPEPVTDPRYYGDVSDVPDLRTALDRIRDARDRFNALPARVRSRFQNDPAELFAFLDDASNREEAVKLGLLKAPVAPPEPEPAPTPTS